ncbi:MAG: glutamate ligase domain-containing protein, partial [Chitinophagaceae bacterium]
FPQDGSGIDKNIDLVIVSTAIEDSVPEVVKSKDLGIPIMKRSELLSIISASKKTIAIGGTSGKSTTAAMLFHIMDQAGLSPSIISGAGLTSLIRNGIIGNASVGKGDFLVIEADESDGSIIQYKSECGVLLNVDKDHKELEELKDIFKKFRNNCKIFIVNQSNSTAAQLSDDLNIDFTCSGNIQAGFVANNFKQNGIEIHFDVNGTSFEMNVLGRHNMENAVAAIAAAKIMANVSLETSSKALKNYEGIYRRHQLIGSIDGVTLYDDFAHNPVKCAASIKACQPLSTKTIAWFQPHGYAPTKFLRNDFCTEISAALRPADEIWMSEIFYAGGTAQKDISAKDLVQDLKNMGCLAYFIEDRNDLVEAMRSHVSPDTTILLMGARDPSLDIFAKEFWKKLIVGW